MEHIAVFAAAKREAFVGYLFTFPAIDLRFRPAYKDYEHFAPYPEMARDMARYDYVLAINHPPVAIPAGLSLREVAQGMTFVLSEVKHGS